VERESRQRMSRVRRTIAARMVESWNQVPRVTSFLEFDATSLLATRAALAESLGSPPPLEALLLRVVAPLLTEFPDFNAYVDGDDVVHYAEYDVGVALDTPAGLLLPVVRGVDELGIAGLAEEVLGLMERARERKLMPADMEGPTFTISNLGGLGGGHCTSILPLRTSTFLSVGRARPTVVLDDAGRPGTVPMTPLDVTIDHRLIDGGPVLRFSRRLIEELEALRPEGLERAATEVAAG
jgi:pyruvate dehydrogenase E2 component (dihydrolipoyllysine-residue acetyltransferase)